MAAILSIDAFQRLDSRENPAETRLFESIVPSGASKGDYEAIKVRDADNSKYHRKGVPKTVENVKSVLRPKIVENGFQLPGDGDKIDRSMIEVDGSDDKTRPVANAILESGMAAWRAAAVCKGVPLYEFV